MGFLNWIGLNDQRTEEDSEPIRVPGTDDILAAVDKTLAFAASSGLHPVVQARVNRVAALVRETLPRLERSSMDSQDSHSVMATATDYLPEALSAYVRLPRDWADSRPVENGKTSLMLLVDQLDLLTVTMEKMLDALARADADELVAHGRFLTARFGNAPTAPAPVPDPAPSQQRSTNPLDLP